MLHNHESNSIRSQLSFHITMTYTSLGDEDDFIMIKKIIVITLGLANMNAGQSSLQLYFNIYFTSP